MAISFKDSLLCKGKQTAPLSAKAANAILPGGYTSDKRYDYYEEYFNDSVSIIDIDRRISLSSPYMDLTQGSNSKYIQFKMPRFYDGFDLCTTMLTIHFVNSNKEDDFDTPINVCYSSDNIRFGWLVDERVTDVEGSVSFEIQAIGANSLGEEYIWKTHPSAGLNIIKSLQSNGIIEPDEFWQTTLIAQMTGYVNRAESAASRAEAAADRAEASGVTNIELDDTLSISGMAADAGAVGAALSQKQPIGEYATEAYVIEQIDSLPISVDDKGYTDIEGLRKTMALDFSNFENGVFYERVAGHATSHIYHVEFDSYGNPIKITDADGSACTITW